MTYAEFVNLVERLWDEIPEAFKKGLQGVHVLPKAKPEPGLKGVWRLGEYLDRSATHRHPFHPSRG
jgi:hypothetical protein